MLQSRHRIFSCRDLHDAAEQILRIRTDSRNRTTLVAEGEDIRPTHPTACEQFEQQLSISERFAPN